MESIVWLIVIGIVIALIVNPIQTAKKEKAANNRFNLSEGEFARIVMKAAKPIKRLTVLSINGPIVCCRILTQSGINEWDFELDFNDHGRITGNYRFNRVDNENKNASIHISFAERIRSDIEEYYLSRK